MGKQEQKPAAVKQQQSSSDQSSERTFWVGLARAFAGALIFAISLFMTMEMWWLGIYLNRFRLILFLVVNGGLLIGLARVRGFKVSIGWLESTIDAFVGYFVGFVTGAIFLYLFGVIDLSMPWNEILGKIALQSVPGSIGALLARSQLGDSGGQEEQNEGEPHNYGRELFLMIAGALFVGFTVAPTEETILIAYRITPGIALGLVIISIVVMHAVVYAVDFRGQHSIPDQGGFWGIFIRFSVAGYGAVLVTSLYLLWTFGRLDGTGLFPIVMTMVVLSIPGAVGAAAARLIL